MMPLAIEATVPSASTIWRAIKLQRRADTGGSSHGAEHRGRMKAGLVGERRRDRTEPAHRFDTDSDAEQRGAAVEIVPLTGRQHRRHHHRAGMDRAALERIVEILAMDRRAVDQRSRRCRQRARVADRGTRPVVIARGKHGLHIILVARCDGEADDIDQQVFALGAHSIGQARRIERTNLLRQMFGDGGFGQFV